MTLFLATCNKMLFLGLLIGVGFLLAKMKWVPEGSEKVLSKLENNLLIPALVFGTFSESFTTEVLIGSWRTVLWGLIVGVVPIPLCVLVARLCTKDEFTGKIYIYGLSLSNFAFMGYAVVNVLFPDWFSTYVIFTLPMFVIAYLWAVPVLLVPHDAGLGVKDALKSLCNPMIIASVLGMLWGIGGLSLPGFIQDTVDAAGGCMSPIAMILTGMTVAKMPFGKVMRMKGIYVLTFFRLIVFPIGFGAIMKWIAPDEITYLCALCALAMPLGLSSVVIPAGYGKDTSVAAGMALVSHLLSVVTIPFVFGIMM